MSWKILGKTRELAATLSSLMIECHLWGCSGPSDLGGVLTWAVFFQPSIVDASEDSQLTAAIAASLQENSYQSTNSVVIHTSDDELDCPYSSCSDLETFSDSDTSRPTSRAALRSGHASQNQPQFSIDDTLVTMPQAGGSKTDADDGAAASTSNGNAVEEIGEEEQWKNFLGSDNGKFAVKFD